MLLGDLVSAFEEFTGPLPASIGCEVPLVVEGAAAGAEDSGGRGVIGWTVLLADADPSALAVGGVSVGPLKLIGCSPATICGVNT